MARPRCPCVSPCRARAGTVAKMVFAMLSYTKVAGAELYNEQQGIDPDRARHMCLACSIGHAYP
jgi:hypothetical protein